MKKLLLLTKTLLAAVLLCVGASNAWGETKTLYPTGSIDPAILSTWSYHANVYTEQGDGYVDFRNQTANNYRGTYIKFFETGSDIYGNYDTYTVSFDFWNNNSWSNTNSSDAEIVFYGEGAGIPNPLYSLFSGSNTTKKNYLLYLHGSGTWINSFYINGSDKDPVSFTKRNWYTASITVTRSTGSVSYSITPQGSSTPITNGSGTYTASSDQTSFNCQGLYFSLGRGCYDTRIANVKVTTEVVPATINSTTGYATFSSTSPVNVTVEGLEAYIATGKNGDYITMQKVTGNIAANTGLVLKGTTGTTYDLPIVASGNTPSGNLLQPCDGSWTTLSKSNTGTNYVLSEQGTPKVAVFAPIGNTSATLRAGSAYLYIDEVSLARALRFSFDDITAVENVEAAAEAKAKEGKFIENGKLVIVKNGVKYNAAGAKLY